MYRSPDRDWSCRIGNTEDQLAAASTTRVHRPTSAGIKSSEDEQRNFSSQSHLSRSSTDLTSYSPSSPPLFAMIARVATFATFLALPVFALAGGVSDCNTGPIQCCNNFEDVSPLLPDLPCRPMTALHAGQLPRGSRAARCPRRRRAECRRPDRPPVQPSDRHRSSSERLPAAGVRSRMILWFYNLD